MKLVYKRQHLMFKYPSSVPPDGPSFAWTEIDESIINNYFAKHKKAFLSFLNQGAFGIALIDEEGWQAYGWLARPGQPFPPHFPSWIYRDSQYWIFYCRTHENHRSQGLYKAVLTRLVNEALVERASPDIYIDTSPDNIAARKAITRTGFVPAGITQTLNIVVPKLTTLHFGNWSKDSAHSAPEVQT